MDEKSLRKQAREEKEVPDQVGKTPQFSEFGGAPMFREEQPVPEAGWYKFRRKMWLYTVVIGVILLLVWGLVFIVLRRYSISFF